MNYAHTRFCELNPDFNGDCSIIGHSLGSVISFDILSSQFVVSSSSSEVEQPTAPPLPIDRAEPNISLKEGNKEIVPTPTDALFASQAYMTEGKNMEKIAAQQLLFHPKAFFAIGSPIGTLTYP